MAIRTRTPSKGWTSVAPYSNYAGVVANYGAALSAVQAEEKNVELQNKILDYRNGTLSYMEMKNYINTRLASETPGTAKELALRETLTNVEDYERDNNVKITRARMMEQFASGGITATEQRQIEESILGLYKQGSAEYANQLATISMAKETERVEGNNEKIMQLSSQLASGDLDTGQQIGIYKQIENITEPGSEDRLRVTAKITELQQQKKQEDKENEMNNKISELMEKFAPGGISNDEALAINREMQKYVDKGSEDYIKLKEQEADILGAIANSAEKTVAKGASEQASRITNELELYYQQSQDLTEAYQRGEINTTDYLAQQSAATSALVGRADQLGEALSPTAAYQLDKQTKLLDEQKAGAEKGEMIQLGTGELVPLSELDNSRYSKDSSFYKDAASAGKEDPGGLETGKVTQAYDSKGQLVYLSRSANGTLYELVPTADGKGLYKTGKVFSPKDQTVKTAAEMAKEQAKTAVAPLTSAFTTPTVKNLPGSGVADKVLEKAEDVKKTLTEATTTYKPVEAVKTALSFAAAPAATVGSKVGSAVAKKVASSLPTLPTPKVSGTIDLGITERLDEIMKGIPSLSSYTPTVGKWNVSTPVGKVNLPDFGITEKIGSLWNQAKTTVKNWWDKLF